VDTSNIKLENYGSSNMRWLVINVMSDRDDEITREWKKLEQEEMKEEDHQLELQDSYVQDEKYDDSED